MTARHYEGLLRQARLGDAPVLARIYSLALPGDVAARFGRDYLTDFMFPALIGSPAGCIVVAENREEIEGFCVRADNPMAMNAAVKSRPAPSLIAAARASLGDPKLVRDLWSSLFGVRRTLDRDIDLARCAEIYLMAITPRVQGEGVGAAVLEEALRGLRGGCIAKTTNAGAASFYARHGFQPIGSEWRGARQLQILYREGN